MRAQPCGMYDWGPKYYRNIKWAPFEIESHSQNTNFER